MNYIDLINHFWRLDEGAQFTGWETKLYFYLIKTANSLGWVNDFWHSDSRVSANVGMSVNTLKTSRNRLKQVGLIEFVSGGKGQSNKTRYQILIPNTRTKQENVVVETPERYQKLTPKPTDKVEEEADRYQNLTPILIPKLTPKVIPKVAPKPPPIIKLNETKLKENNSRNNLPTVENDLPEKNEATDETLPEVAAQKSEAATEVGESFTKEQLKADLLKSEIGRMAAKNSEIKPEEYAQVVETFVETKFGLEKHKNWKDIIAARENFLYWIPYYKNTIAHKHGKPFAQKTPGSGRKIVEQTADDDSVVEPGTDGVLRRVSGKGVQTFAG
ncbi:hypothetical protein [Emticicia agri]|nr:hypothetical protein [Emticicia agri]